MSKIVEKKKTAAQIEQERLEKKMKTEMDKVETTLSYGAFNGIDTYDKFLAEAKKMFESYGLKFDPKNFQFASNTSSQSKSNVANKKP